MVWKGMKQDVDNWLNNYFKDKGTYNKILYDAMEYSIIVGGKRIRPILMLTVYNMYKNDYKKIMPVACAMEMIHTYSLIHDDLPCMDNDDLRRGKPTNHKVYGYSTAVLAGDALLNEAENILFNYCLENTNAIRACKIISESAGADGMVGGQVVDLIGEKKHLTKEEFIYMNEKKTGELIKSSILAGAILAGANEDDIGNLKEYGENLGLAFQIKDDILDVTGDVENLGKNTNKDIQMNKTNFISIYGLNECKSMCMSLTEKCCEILRKLNVNTEELNNITKFLLEREK